MKRRVVAVLVTMLCSLVAWPKVAFGAAAGMGSGATGCNGFGSIGPALLGAVGCAEKPGSSRLLARSPGLKPPEILPSSVRVKGVITTPGYFLKPMDNDWGYETCPNKTGPDMPSALQEYNPHGAPVGLPIVVCPGPGTTLTTAPPAPAPPPGPDAVWAVATLPRLGLGMDPASVGITQVPTWFWATGVPRTLELSLNLGGYALEVTIKLLGLEWSFGDGSGAQSLTGGGPTDPAVVHTYGFKGTYGVQVTAEYQGSYAYQGPAGSGEVGLGVYADGPGSSSYVVQEVSPLLVPSAYI